MRKLLLSVVLITFIYMTQAANPFFGKYKTPHETTPFNKIKVTDYEPAFEEGMRQHQKEIDVIIGQYRHSKIQSKLLMHQENY